jgi:hypothetical protein
MLKGKEDCNGYTRMNKILISHGLIKIKEQATNKGRIKKWRKYNMVIDPDEN